MKKVLITAGGTNEKIDNVREITNTSTGRLGSLIADELANDYDVYYVHGKHAYLPTKDVQFYEVDDTISLSNTLLKLFETHSFDFIIHAMAISDYHVDRITSKSNIINNLLAVIDKKDTITYSDLDDVFFDNSFDENTKIDSSIDDLIFSLHKNIKVIDIIKDYQPDTFLISFKLQNNISKKDLIDIAYKQMQRTQSQIVVANLVEEINDMTHRAYILDEDKNIKEAKTKKEIATIIGKIVRDNS